MFTVFTYNHMLLAQAPIYCYPVMNSEKFGHMAEVLAKKTKQYKKN